MIRAFLISLAGATILAGGASAADLYRPGPGGLKDGPVYVPVNSWSGFYIGANIGYGWNANSKDIGYDVLVAPDTEFTDRSRGAEPSGVFGGGQIGYNVQHGRFVYGIEADIQGADISDDVSATSAVNLVSGTVHEKMDWFGTVRGRFGVAYDSALLYVTGGFAYGNIDERINATVDGLPYSIHREDVHTGFTVGGGVEYAFSPSWSVKGEYLYIDLGSDRISGSPGAGIIATTTDIDHTFHTVRLGLNYHLHREYEPLK